MKGASGGGDDGGQWGVRGVCVCLVLLASCTARNVLADKGGKSGPPKLGCNELVGLENTRVTCCGMVMVSGDNRAAEGGVGGDIDTILEGQDTSIILPIRETRSKFGREFAGECVEGIKDKGVSCGGSSKPVREGGVDEIDEEGVGEEGDIFIIRIQGGDVVWAAGESIWGTKVSSWDVEETKVKLGDVEEPAGLASVEFLGLVEVCEVFMVGEYLDGGGGAKEIVSPGV